MDNESYALLFLQGDSILADSGTEQLEFIALSQRTGDPKYQLKVSISFTIPILCNLLGQFLLLSAVASFVQNIATSHKQEWKFSCWIHKSTAIFC